MLRIRPHFSVVALGQVPYSADIVNLVRSLNGKCFTSKQWLPGIKRAMDFAQSGADKSWWRFVPGQSDDTYASLSKEMSNAYFRLKYWYDRLSAEAEANYCTGTKNGQPNGDWNLIVQSLVLPFQIASGVEGVKDVSSQAVSQLHADLTTPSKWIPNFFAEMPKWVLPVALGAGALLIFNTFRKPKVIVQQVTAPPAGAAT